MTVVDQVFRERDVPENARGYTRDTTTLGWEDRTHAHGRRRTEGGVEFGTTLPRGTVLRAGDCFVLDDERRVVICLLYTSPSPRDRQKSRMPSSA